MYRSFAMIVFKYKPNYVFPDNHKRYNMNYEEKELIIVMLKNSITVKFQLT